MSVRTASSISDVEAGYTRAKQIAGSVKTYTSAKSLQLESDVSSDKILEIGHTYRRFLEELDAIKIIPGMLQYAKDREADQAYDFISEMAALISNMRSIMDAIRTTFPNTGGYLLAVKLTEDFNYDFRIFTVAQAASFKATLDSIILGID